MFNKKLSKFIDKKVVKESLKYVFYNKESGEYVATDGHVMGIEKTQDTYETDKFLSPLTGLPVDAVCTFPNYQKVISESGDIVDERVFKTYTRIEKSKWLANKIVQIRDAFVDFNFLKTALDFIGTSFVLTMNEPNAPIKFVSLGGLRTAVLMPLRMDELSNYTATEDIDSCESVRTQSKAAKYVYVAFDSSGAVRGVFNKKSDAVKESTGDVKEFPLI